MGFWLVKLMIFMFFCEAEIQHQLAMDHPNICRLLEAWLDSGGWMTGQSLTTENFPFFSREPENPLRHFLVKFLLRMWCREKKHTLMEIV